MKQTQWAAFITTPVLLLGCQSNTAELGGTSWNVVEVVSTAEPDLADMDIQFGTDGWVTTTITRDDGSIETTRRSYNVHRSLLMVDDTEKGDLELLYSVRDGQLILTAENFQARLRRTN